MYLNALDMRSMSEEVGERLRAALHGHVEPSCSAADAESQVVCQGRQALVPQESSRVAPDWGAPTPHRAESPSLPMDRPE
jgi:hypothetical protein